MANKVITVTTPSVGTGDTVASYNAYSDQDGALGSLSVAEAAAGKTFSLSDGVVHSVTVKPVGTSSGEYNAPSDPVTVDLSVPNAPTVVSGDYTNAGLVLTFSEPVNGTYFGYQISGGSSTYFNSWSGNGTNTITLGQSALPDPTDTMLLSYTENTDDLKKTSAVTGGAFLVNFSAFSITNSVV